jgi:hypothetical protein
MKESHDEIEWRKKLPRVGQTIRRKKDGTLWRVMEKREVWQNIEDDPRLESPAWCRLFILPSGALRKG